jgi:hypothetical protein
MKAKIITAIIGLTVTTIVPVYADGIQSPRGISQSAWNSSSTYQNFQCPSGTSRGEGVDMNYTTDRSDDYWFVNCEPIVIYTQPIPIPTPTVSDTPTVTITPTPTVTETSTVTSTVSSNSTISSTNTSSTVVTPTLTNNQLITLILELFNKIIALLALLK